MSAGRSRGQAQDYSLAPEHPFPAAGLDASATPGGLIADGARAIAITGDSAGGNLALALLSSATARALASSRRIAGAVVLSPITDLTLGGTSWADRAQADPFFLKDQAQGLIDSSLAGHDAIDPAASPLFADPTTGLPPSGFMWATPRCCLRTPFVTRNAPPLRA